MNEDTKDEELILRLEREGSYLLSKMLKEAIGLQYDDFPKTPTFDECDGNVTDEL